MHETSSPPRLLLLLGLGLPLLAAGCAGLDDDLFRERTRTIEYRCDDDRRLRITYRDGGEEARVQVRDQTYRLDLRERDGRRRQYGRGDVQLFVNGDEARLRIKDRPDYQGCEER